MAAVTGNATHQAALLGAMALAGESARLTLDALDASLSIGRKQIATAAGKLILRGYVDRAEAGVYSLTLTGREALKDGVSLKSGPHRGKRKHPIYRDTLTQRAWAAMRLQNRFTIGALATLAATERDKKPEESLQRFVHRLKDAGYVVELATRVRGVAETSNGFKQFKLVRDTGEQAPRWLDKQKAFKDWNTREVFKCARK
jgi:hypothetical protein